MRAIKVLEEHGYLERVPEGATINGKRPRDAYKIVARRQGD
jgi:hypothetical protein